MLAVDHFATKRPELKVPQGLMYWRKTIHTPSITHLYIHINQNTPSECLQNNLLITFLLLCVEIMANLSISLVFFCEFHPAAGAPCCISIAISAAKLSICTTNTKTLGSAGQREVVNFHPHAMIFQKYQRIRVTLSPGEKT